MGPSIGPEADRDEQLSMDVAKAVGSMFVRNAAWLALYKQF